MVWQSDQQDPALFAANPKRAIASSTASELERRSFEFYRYQTASALAHTLESSFWTDFVLRVSHSEPAIRHALVAIGALYEGLVPVQAGRLPSSDTHLKVALSSYNKAIKCMTTENQLDRSNLTALLTCILFVCIELLQDNIAEALMLVQQGCGILKAYRTNGGHTVQHQQAMIDHQVIPMFTGLIVLSGIAGCPTSLQISGEVILDRCTQLYDLKRARMSLYILMDQGLAIIRRAGDCKWLQDDAPELANLLLEQVEAKKKLERWNSSFALLQKSLDLSKSTTRHVQAVSILSMYFTTTSIWLSACLERAQVYYDEYQPHFEQILQAAELVINLPQQRPRGQVLFTFEMGLIPPLYFTAQRCRVPKLRRQAISLLQRAPSKEGMWNRAEMVYLANRVIQIEERENVDSNDVLELPRETTRLHDVHSNYEYSPTGQRKNFVIYMSKPGGLHGPMQTIKEYYSI